MSRYNHSHRLTGRDYFYRIAMGVAAVAVLSFFIPRQSFTHYQFKLGEPWDDSPVIAQDSFPVLKGEAALQRERDSLRGRYEPYFLMDGSVADAQLRALAAGLRSQDERSVPRYYLAHLADKLRRVYSQGVMEAGDYERLTREGTAQVWVYQRNESTSRRRDQLFTEKSAYEFMMAEEDSARFSHGRLLRCKLEQYLRPNLSYDAGKSRQQRQEVDNMLVPYMGQVQVGQKIVDRGQIVDGYTFQVLRSLEAHQRTRSKSMSERLVQWGGQTLYVAIMVTLLFCYFLQFRNDYLDAPRSVLLILSLCMVFPLVTYGMVSHSVMSVYVVPYCVLPMLIRIFMDSRTAFITHAITILTCAVALRHPYEFILTQLTAGLTAIFSLRQLSQRSELFRAAVVVTLATLLSYFCLDMVHGNLFGAGGFDRWTYIYLCLAGVLSLLSYLLLIPIERIFGFTSNVTLVELSNINSKVLRRLSEEAPGTFQHSMQVSNLAAEVANRIGGKSQLVRTGALYHDIGKLENAVFFTENQSGANPHDGLPYERSAQIIIRHVSDGLALAERYKLPPVIREFIATHHGRSMARYFYVSCKNKYPDRPVDASLFTYPGPNPHTLEQAILMMADSVEAASRSMKEYTEESIGQMVEKIVGSQVSEGYFSVCPITFLEIEEAKEVFKSKLRTIYHTRVQYPELAGKGQAGA